MKIREKYKRKRMRKRQLITMFMLGVVATISIISFTKVVKHAMDYFTSSILNQFESYERYTSYIEEIEK